MSNEKERVGLRTVDEGESTVEEPRLVRLHKDAVEEVAQEVTVRVGGKPVPEARLEAASREELKTRSIEPDVGSLIERDQVAPLEDQWVASPPPRKVPWGWLVLIAAAFAFGIIWSLSKVTSAERRHDELRKQTRSILEKDVAEEISAENTVATLERTARDFFDSRSIDELLRYVRHPERVRPLMEDYYSRHELKPSRVDSIVGMDPLTLDRSGSFWIVSSILEPNKRNEILLEAVNADTAKVDWETFVCYQPVPWNDFVEQRPPGFTDDFRVYVEPDHFYSYEFSDSEKYQSFRLTVLNSDEPLYGYVPRDSLLAKEIGRLLQDAGRNLAPMILRLNIPENAKSKRGVLIEKLVAPRWVFIESREAGGQ